MIEKRPCSFGKVKEFTGGTTDDFICDVLCGGCFSLESRFVGLRWSS